MGYRLNIYKIKENENFDKEIKDIYYGTKLFGYTDPEELLSYIYLKSTGKLNGDEYFDYSSDISIPLNQIELTIFLNLYNIDLIRINKETKEKFLEQLPIKKELIKNINEFNPGITYLIEWN